MTLECIKSENPNKYEVDVKGKFNYKALIDTGANASFLSKKVYEKEGLVLNGKSTTIKQAVGSFKTLESTYWMVKNATKKINIKFHVVENFERDIIFGQNAIKSLRLNIKGHLLTLKSAENENLDELKFDNETLDIGDDKTREYVNEVKKICEDFQEIFSTESKVDSIDYEHSIELLENHNSFSCPKYRRSIEDDIIIEEKVKEFLDRDMIVESRSRYVSPVVLVKKKNGDVRFCID
ncbi:Transposon Ty3-I Gag-Pol polyprotein [Dictyocoela muelleri]|nr:Transposon Ty3-I Gag-Pol polyprotein [Dictyocoela muelleri]